MCAREARGLHDQLVVAGTQPRDVLSDGAGKEADLLRQVAEMAAEPIALPGRDVGAVEPHRAGT